MPRCSSALAARADMLLRVWMCRGRGPQTGRAGEGKDQAKHTSGSQAATPTDSTPTADRKKDDLTSNARLQAGAPSLSKPCRPITTNQRAVRQPTCHPKPCSRSLAFQCARVSRPRTSGALGRCGQAPPMRSLFGLSVGPLRLKAQLESASHAFFSLSPLSFPPLISHFSLPRSSSPLRCCGSLVGPHGHAPCENLF